jgi:hypothetical protein
MARIEITQIERFDEVEALKDNVYFRVHYLVELPDGQTGEDTAEIRVNRDVLENALSPFKSLLLSNFESRYIRQRLDVQPSASVTVTLQGSNDLEHWRSIEYPPQERDD